MNINTQIKPTPSTGQPIRAYWPNRKLGRRRSETLSEAVEALHAAGRLELHGVHVLHVGQARKGSVDACPFDVNPRLPYFIRDSVRDDPDNEDALDARLYGPCGHLWPQVFCDTVFCVRVPYTGIATVYLRDGRSQIRPPEAMLRFLAFELHGGYWRGQFAVKAVADTCAIRWHELTLLQNNLKKKRRHLVGAANCNSPSRSNERNNLK